MYRTMSGIFKWSLVLFMLMSFPGCSSEHPSEAGGQVPPSVSPGEGVKNTVFVIFKTHLDVGFTALPSEVEKQYVETDIPKALDVIDELRVYDGDANRYIWTIGTWAIDTFLKTAPATEVARLEKAIENGDIVWNAMPYTIETEMTTSEMLDAMLGLSKRLDRKYGKHTVSAKMSDVPGHTRSMIPSLSRAGVKLLHISQNRSTTLPELPAEVCRWVHPDGSEVLLLDKKPYSHEIALPDGNVLSVNLKQDNRGPHTVAEVRKIYKDLRAKYPTKTVIAYDLNRLAEVLEKYKDRFPVFTGEIGDTWVHGFGSAPERMSKVRALNRLFREWIRDGKIDPESDAAVDYAVRLGLVSEHTWGLDSKKYLGHEEPSFYDIDGFTSALENGTFSELEKSWKEIDDYILQAVALLPDDLRQEAVSAIVGTSVLPSYRPAGQSLPEGIGADGSFTWCPSPGNGSVLAGLFTLQTFGFDDYRAWVKTWMTSTSAKAGMAGSQAVSARVHPAVTGAEVTEDSGERVIRCSMDMQDSIDDRLYPGMLLCEYRTSHSGTAVDIEFTIVDKPANRMAEAYWLSFVPTDILSVSVEKMGSMVGFSEVVSGGNGRMHGIDRYVEILTAHGSYRIYSPDVPLVLAGSIEDLSYRSWADISKGVHFNLFNNLWGVNFSMWWQGSQCFRFRIEKI